MTGNIYLNLKLLKQSKQKKSFSRHYIPVKALGT